MQNFLAFFASRRGIRALFGLLGCVLLLAGCAPTPVRSPAPTPPPVAAPAFVADPPEVALPALVAAERQAAAERNLPLLATLWATDAQVVDSRNTVDAGDDYLWRGHAAVLDRYVVAVFPNPPVPFAEPPALEITVTGDEATGQLGQDAWRFVWRDGRWLLAELIIEPAG